MAYKKRQIVKLCAYMLTIKIPTEVHTEWASSIAGDQDISKLWLELSAVNAQLSIQMRFRPRHW